MAYAFGVAGGSSAPFGSGSGSAGALGGGAALFRVGGAAEVGRRIDIRVTARITASASATSPTTCAPTVEAPAGAAEVKLLATCSAGPVWEGCGEPADCGLDRRLTVGNSPEALPPGLGNEDGDTGRVGRASAVAPGGVGDTAAGVGDTAAGVGDTAAGVGDTAAGVGGTAAGAGGARMVMASDTAGSVRRLAALPVAVRLTDVTVDAVAGTVSCAWSSRIVEVASTAPRSHEAVPSPCPQPKLKIGAPAPEGVACSWSLTSGTFPPVVQASTAQWAACPRSRLCCRSPTPTHTLTCVEVGEAAAA